MKKALKNKITEIKKLMDFTNNSKLRRAIFDLEEMMDKVEKVKDAYIDEYGVYRWLSNNRVPFDDMLECWTDDEFQLNACREARDKDDAEFLAEYRERMEDYEPDAETLYEMRSAFGEGETVVNVFTGKEIQL